jgi:hypothetical protein
MGGASLRDKLDHDERARPWSRRSPLAFARLELERTTALHTGALIVALRRAAPAGSPMSAASLPRQERPALSMSARVPGRVVGGDDGGQTKADARRSSSRVLPCPCAATRRAIPLRALGPLRSCASLVASFAAGGAWLALERRAPLRTGVRIATFRALRPRAVARSPMRGASWPATQADGFREDDSMSSWPA